MQRVYLIHGFGACDLGIAGTKDVIWWDPSIAMLNGIGVMRLAANGQDPGPPDGKQLGVVPDDQDPWPFIKLVLQLQLGLPDWIVSSFKYDWRFKLEDSVQFVADRIRAQKTREGPATLVAHSAGGLISVLVWANLVATGEEGLIRRIITMGTPFQGSYFPMLWLNGTGGMIQQVILNATFAVANGLLPALNATLDFLNGVALTWPSFYELFPFLGGSEANKDPNRPLLYNAADYPATAQPSEAWLAHAAANFQPMIEQETAYPPDWVLTCVYGTGFDTPERLGSARTPLELGNLRATNDGDGVVTHGSAVRIPSAVVQVTGTHSNIPGYLAVSGLLKKLVLDERTPITPKPSKLQWMDPITANVTDPPAADEITGGMCLSPGG